MADRIGILSEGELVQIGSPREIYETPANLYVAARLGQPQMNILPAGLIECPMPQGTVVIGARTEHLRIKGARNGEANGRIGWVEHLGDQNHLHVELGGRKIVSLTEPGSGFRAGDEVKVELNAPLFFDQTGARIA